MRFKRHLTYASVMATVAVFGVVAGGPASSAGDALSWRSPIGGQINNPDYRGHFAVPDRKGKIRIAIRRDRKGRPVGGQFEVRRILLDCEGGPHPSQKRNLGSLRVDFHTERRFDGSHYNIFENGGLEAVYLVKGQLSPDERRIQGTLVVLYNPGEVGDEPYCSTGGKLGWKATRIG